MIEIVPKLFQSVFKNFLQSKLRLNIFLFRQKLLMQTLTHTMTFYRIQVTRELLFFKTNTYFELQENTSCLKFFNITHNIIKKDINRWTLSRMLKS